MQPTVTVILTAESDNEGLRRSIASVLRQSYPGLELLLVPVGAAMRQVCAGLAREDTRITVMDKEVEYIAAARNTGLCMAHGKYVNFLDTGNVMAENMIGTLAQPLKQSGAGLAVCDARFVFGQIAKPTLFQSGLNLRDVPLALEGLQPAASLYTRYVEEEPTGLLHMGAMLLPKDRMIREVIFSDERYFCELFELPEILQRCNTAYCVCEPLLTVEVPSNDFSSLFVSPKHLKDFFDAHLFKTLYSYRCGYRECSYRLDRRIFESLSSLWLPKLQMFGQNEKSWKHELYRRREWYDAQHWMIQNGKTTLELLREVF